MAEQVEEAVIPLWESDHPYYCNEGNFYKRDHHHRWDTWAAFYEAWGDNDRDMNLVFRWDWHPYGDDPGPGRPADLHIYVMLQRKGFNMSHSVSVLREEEPAVRAFLAECWEKLRELWAPLSGRQPAAVGGEVSVAAHAHDWGPTGYQMQVDPPRWLEACRDLGCSAQRLTSERPS